MVKITINNNQFSHHNYRIFKNHSEIQVEQTEQIIVIYHMYLNLLGSLKKYSTKNNCIMYKKFSKLRLLKMDVL